jgi:SAM-dependent methyltransferase
LDIGANDGHMLSELCRHSRKDYFAVALEKEVGTLKGFFGAAICANADAIPMCDGFFDYVVCSATRKHVRNSLAMAKEAYRVLRPGGKFLVIDPCAAIVRIGVLVGKFDRRYLHHVPNRNEICAELKHAGFESVRVTGVAFVQATGIKAA